MQKQEIRSESANENIKSFQMEGGLTGLRPWQSLFWSQHQRSWDYYCCFYTEVFLLLFSLDSNNITMGSLKAVNNIQKPSFLVFLSQNYFRKSLSVILTTTLVLLSYKIWHLLLMLHFIVRNLTQTKNCYQCDFQKNVKFLKPNIFCSYWHLW